MTALRLGLVLAALALCPLPAVAQVPPTAAEAAAYTGLHAAAWRGDVPAVERLAAGGKAALEARDAQGRTPLHVATFARQRGAVKALLKAGADTAAFENGRYDAVTIAAVADDEETLAILLAAGREREARHQPLRRHCADRRRPPRARRRGPAADRRPARRSTTSTTCTGPR